MSYHGRHKLPEFKTFDPVNLRGRIVYFSEYLYDGYTSFMYMADGSIPWRWEQRNPSDGCPCSICRTNREAEKKEGPYIKVWRDEAIREMVNGCMFYPLTEKQKCTLNTEPEKPGSTSADLPSAPVTRITLPSVKPKATSKATTTAAGSTRAGRYDLRKRIFPAGSGQPRSASNAT